MFHDAGYKLLETTYINANTKMKYLCPKHGEHEITLSKLRQGQGCNECGIETTANKARHSYDFVKQTFENNGYELISKEYINSSTPLSYICTKHPDYGIQKIRLSDIMHGHGCYVCGRDAIRGENNTQWKGGHSDVDEMFRNLLDGWVVKQMQRTHYTCEITGKHGTLNVHHMTPFKKIVTITLKKLGLPYHRIYNEYSQEELSNIAQLLPIINEEIANPIVMLKNVHNEFHKFCGGNHVPTSFKQLDEFKRLIKEGAINV